ncbi:MAG: hypothetical protein EOM40_08440 [Clostridia bacterium]|nr:hypothetical protein [Clostridia bacterium]
MGNMVSKRYYVYNKKPKGCKIPSYMVPRCPVCGGEMAMNLRSDQYFVEDAHWHEQDERFGEFLTENMNKKIVLLEMGVGFNTPMIIRFPFEKLVREHKNISLIRLNLNEAVVPESFGDRAIGINADISKVLWDISRQGQSISMAQTLGREVGRYEPSIKRGIEENDA